MSDKIVDYKKLIWRCSLCWKFVSYKNCINWMITTCPHCKKGVIQSIDGQYEIKFMPKNFPKYESKLDSLFTYQQYKIDWSKFVYQSGAL